MKGIYLTQEGKEEIEANIAELETYQHSIDDIEHLSDEDCFYIGERGGEIFKLKEILSSATILPVEESWDKIDEKIINAVINNELLEKPYHERQYPQGVIIQPKQ